MEDPILPDQVASIAYIICFGLSCLFWALQLSTWWVLFSSGALLCIIAVGSLKEGELYWPKLNGEPYRSPRVIFHVLIAVSVIVSTFLVLLSSDDIDTWNATNTTSAGSMYNGSMPVSWKLSFLATAVLYGLSSVPTIMALSNKSLWDGSGDELNRIKRMLSLNVLKEIVVTSFLVPLIYGASDLVDDSNDSEWRAYAASLVFTLAVIYFVVFWYVTDWSPRTEDASPLEDDRIISKICRACGMFIVYVVLIRRLHEDKALKLMEFVSVKDNMALVGGFLIILTAYVLRLRRSFNIGVPTPAVISILFVILFLMFISITL